MYFSIWLATLVPLRGQLRGQRIVCHATPYIIPNNAVGGCVLRHTGHNETRRIDQQFGYYTLSFKSSRAFLDQFAQFADEVAS